MSLQLNRRRILTVNGLAVGMLVLASLANPASAAQPSVGVLASLPLPASASIGVVGAESGGGSRSFVPFGYDSGPRGEGAIGTGTRNPQPVFYAPLGTAVLAPINGTVTQVTKLYSGDFSIMFAASPNARTFWEVEHVITPKVKKGDRVKAGQAVGQVSDYDSRNTPGIGIVELGLLQGGNPPQHICPFLHVEKKASARIQRELNAILAADSARGLGSAPMAPLGCIGTQPIAG